MAKDSQFPKVLMQQLQQMQEQVLQAQEELKEKTVTASAGGGAVKVTLTGDQRCTELVINPQVLEEADAGMLQDLMITAFNKALEESRQLAVERLGPLSAGLSL
jgi:DNA-binding YbaB/EbfC family protein